MTTRPLNVGLIGGGSGSFIALPHQRAIHFDGTRRVTAAALRRDSEASIQEARAWPYPIQGYGSYKEMIETEAKRPVGERVDYVVIVTPNDVHFEPAAMCIDAGIPVFCEKPLTATLADAKALAELVSQRSVPFAVAHTYLGHWTTQFARHIVQSGLLGEIRWVDSYYLQGWLAGRAEDAGVTQAEWRVDPARSGGSCCGGDIGTHALMQLRYVTGLDVNRLSARLETFVEGRTLDDHFTAYCELSNGGRALVRASQIAIGHKNDLGIEINGSKGTLIWRQEEPDALVIRLPDEPDRTYWRASVTGNDGFLGDVPDDLLASSTLPPGHGEAFHDAFARLHRSFERDVRAYIDGEPFACDGAQYANVDDGLIGIEFIEAAVESSKNEGAWVNMPSH